MRISVLSENTALDERFSAEHGLSLHIAYGDQNILFDMGASHNFIDNAMRLGIDISKVDIAVISHGHDDHGGGLGEFMRVNNHAKIYVHRLAFGEYWSQKTPTMRKRIALDPQYRDAEQIRLIDEDTELAEGVRTMCDIERRYPMPVTNGNLLEKVDGEFVPDTFDHEQDLVMRLESGYLLIVGCAHNGMKNILEHFKAQYGTMPTHVVGGFHLSSRTASREPIENIDALGDYLNSTGAHYYTCHCTGERAYSRLKAIMGKNIEYISTGSVVDII